MIVRDRRKKGSWSFKEERLLIELASTSLSLEPISGGLIRSATSVLQKSLQLGLSIKPSDEIGLRAKAMKS
jgi:hypothetical protein